MENLRFMEELEHLNYEGQRLLFSDSISEKTSHSKIIMVPSIDSNYLNLAINLDLDSLEDFKTNLKEITETMKNRNKIPSILVKDTSLISNIDFNDFGFKPIDTSTWLILDNLKSFPIYKSKLDIKIEEFHDENYDIYSNVVSKGFSNDDINEPYHELDFNIKQAIEKSCYINPKNFTNRHFIALNNNTIIGTLTIMYINNICYVYNVTTNKNYRNLGVCKELMSFVIKHLANININYVCLQTETGFYPEKFYKKLGFKEIFKATTYIEEI